jgi:hypothetical protein
MRWNAIQAELNRASACRQMAGLEEVTAIRDAIRPLMRRHIASLAAMIAAQPITERRTRNRRVRRGGRKLGVAQ